MSVPAEPGSARSRAAERLLNVSACLLLACLAGRAVLQEMPFRTNPLNVDSLIAAAESEALETVFVETGDLARTTFAMVLLSAVLFWLLGFLLGGGGRRLRGAWSLVLIAGWCAWTLWSATEAADALSALLVWVEQSALLLAGFVAMQVFADRRRFVVLGSVMAAVGGLLAVRAGWQLLVEYPQVVEEFHRNRVLELARLGARPGSAKAAMLEERILEPTAKGFGGLANLFAAQLLPLLGAGGGLAAAKLLYARHRRRREGNRRGEIPLPSVLGWIAAVVSAGAGGALLLTHSRGGVAAGVIAAAGAVAVVKFRAKLAGHWRATVLAAGGVLVAGLATLVGMGLLTGRLPGKSLTFRWLYWRGAVEIVAENPVLGVGPGNFADPYLRVRPPEAEEEVKTPHNVVAHALAQFGLPGGAMYLAAVVGFLVLAGRPGRVAQPPPAEEKTPDGPEAGVTEQVGRWVLVVLLAAVVGAVRFRVSQPVNEFNVPLLILDALLPAGVFAGLLIVLLPWGGAAGDLPASTLFALRVGLSAGCVAFFLHNMVSYGLWSGGSATAFWIAAGAAAGRGAREWNVRLRQRLGVFVCGLMLLAPLATAGWVLVERSRILTEVNARIARAAARGALQRAADLACDVPERRPPGWWPADDMYGPMNAARLAGSVEQKGRKSACEPLDKARLATAYRPGHFGTWRLLGQIALPKAGQGDAAARKARVAEDCEAEGKLRDTAVRAYGRAVALNPADAALRLEYAEALLEAGQKDRARQQLDEAERMDQRLRAFNPQSVVVFGSVQKQRLAELRRRAEAGMR